MKNSQKSELIAIVKRIPNSELDKKVSDIWRRYAPSFSYQTFRNYLRAFRMSGGSKG